MKLQQANFHKGSGPNSQFHYVTRFQLNPSSMKSQTKTKKSEVRKQLYTTLYCGVWQSTLCIILLTETNTWLHWTSLPKLLSYYLFFIWKRKFIVSDYGWRIMDWSSRFSQHKLHFSEQFTWTRPQLFCKFSIIGKCGRLQCSTFSSKKV